MILRKEGVHKKENDMIIKRVDYMQQQQMVAHRKQQMNNKMAKKVVSLSTLLLKKGHIEGVEKCWVNE